MSFARFMAGPIGRGARVLVGVVMIAVGLVVGSTGGYVLAAIGVLPLVAGVANICVLGPLMKAPLSGKAVLRAK
ncbi:MAG: YgaP-like transmembrane domain [Acidimicrobiia bacterium]